jgi:hypothetical protein
VGFKYRDHFNQATNSIFKLDSDILSAKLQGGSIEIGGFYHHPKLVDNPRLWRADLDVYLPTRAAWNLTEGFFGRLTIGDNPVTFTPSVRQNLTAAGLMVPEDISLVRFTQRTAIPSASVSLPKPVADGQPIQFVNYDGAVKSFTFLPPVHGWVNGSAFAANSGVRIRWDANEAAWYREE